MCRSGGQIYVSLSETRNTPTVDCVKYILLIHFCNIFESWVQFYIILNISWLSKFSSHSHWKDLLWKFHLLRWMKLLPRMMILSSFNNTILARNLIGTKKKDFGDKIVIATLSKANFSSRSFINWHQFLNSVRIPEANHVQNCHRHWPSPHMT